MTLIKSISGIRGTIGGQPGNALTPIDVVKFTAAYAATLPRRKPQPNGERYKIVVGKDARMSGDMVEQLVVGTLIGCGIDVVKCGFASTPTTEMAVLFARADGGIILTASHNPRQWNALKLLNEKGEFLTAAEGQAVLDLAEKEDFNFAEVDRLGNVEEEDFTDKHLDAVLALPAVDVEAVKAAHFTVVVDAINSVGGIIMPRLLKRLGVKCIGLNCNPTGDFAHNPEPLPANLVDLCETVVKEKADLGVSVDPDVDRLAFICENGEPFVEEYTLVAVADYLLDDAVRRGVKPLATVSNLSSSRLAQLALLDSAVNVYSKPYLKEAAPYLWARATARMNVGKHRLAVLDMNEYENLNPTGLSANFYYIREQAELGGRQFQQALNDITKATELEPNDLIYHAEKSSLESRVGMYDDAIRSARECIRLAPNESDGYLLLGLALCQKATKQKASRSCRRPGRWVMRKLMPSLPGISNAAPQKAGGSSLNDSNGMSVGGSSDVP